MKVYPNGLETLGGDDLLSQAPLWVGGAVWWVNSVTGSDAASPAGQDRERPLATLAQAITNSAAGDIVVLQSGHTETLTGAQGILGRTVVGVGTTSGKPAAQLLINAAAASCLNLDAAGSHLRNIYFPAAVQSDTGNGKVRIASVANCSVVGCYFESSGLDQMAAIQIDVSSTGARVQNCTFVSTATAIATRPTRGLYTGGAVTDLFVTGNVFDDGTVGYSTAALDFSAAANTRLVAYGNSLLRGADAKFHASQTGIFGVGTLTGGSGVSW